MKNKISKLLFTIILIVNFGLILHSDEIDIKSSEINILNNGKLLTGNNGFTIISTNNIEISGTQFSYNKETQKLNAKGKCVFADCKWIHLCSACNGFGHGYCDCPFLASN